jgi:hypothetical protein
VAVLYARREGLDEVRRAVPRALPGAVAWSPVLTDVGAGTARQAKVASLILPGRPPPLAKGPRSEFDDAVRSIVRTQSTPPRPPPEATAHRACAQCGWRGGVQAETMRTTLAFVVKHRGLFLHPERATNRERDGCAPSSRQPLTQHMTPPTKPCPVEQREPKRGG